eukprot:CAMPEP_0115867040 /NCGR_PEP_ID=MMETSP0287-20121206/20562_1 /TAXON_ID=412157 /ORGANISM="Chrysochromulina rotalis, Strain UIO044" /LENGTH=60 /DNA_ID=CAMNT_0003321631 /DNA_START=851 /DNA_END=1033 /DNA_ORIENTATION=+
MALALCDADVATVEVTAVMALADFFAELAATTGERGSELRGCAMMSDDSAFGRDSASEIA